jgi:hypothetical protein
MTYTPGRSGQSWPDVTSQARSRRALAWLAARDGASLSRRSVSRDHWLRAVQCVRYSLCGDGVTWIPSGQETLGESGTMF